MTEKEKVEMQREAFVQGAWWAFDHRAVLVSDPFSDLRRARIDESAAEYYPDPANPRVVIINGAEVRFVEGRFEFRAGGAWNPSVITTECIKQYTDLMASPTEPVED